MATKKYRLGVLGLGEGRSIISAALESEHWELANICDLNEDLCKERLEEFGFDKYTLNYEDMLNDPEIDVISIYTPDQLHGLHIRQALEAGKHVIVTKPMLTSLEEAQDLLKAAEKAGKHVFVGQSSRFFEPMIHQRKDFEAGRLGELSTVDAYYIADARWFLERGWVKQKGFSWLFNFLSHAVDLAKWYLPNIEEVFAYGYSSPTNTEHGLTTPDAMRCLLKDDQGRIAQVSGSYTNPALRNVDPGISCTLRGTLGTTRAVYSQLNYYTKFTGEPTKVHSFEEKHPYYFRFEGNSHHAGEYQNYIEYFAKCLDNGETPLPDLSEGIHTVAIMTALERSMETGQPVKVKDVLKEYGL